MVIGRKLFDEIDKPIGYKKVYENSYGLEIEASWDGIIKGYNGFPDGKNVGSGNPFEGKNGIIISNWDMNKMGKFVVLRTYSTNSKKLSWINGLVCLLEGIFNKNEKEFRSTGYEWIF